LNQSLANDLLALYLDIDEMDRHHDQKENELHQMRKALSASSKECRKLKNVLERTTSFVNCKNVEHAARTSDLRRRIKKRKESVIEAQEKAEEEEPYLANKKNVTNAVIKTSKHMDVASGMVVNGT
jgi:septal ring factor EnvC (AmiA/AmiB activator)